jgi:hypothetical protein
MTASADVGEGEMKSDREIAQKFAKEFNEWVIDTADLHWTECNDDIMFEDTITAAAATAREEGRRDMRKQLKAKIDNRLSNHLVEMHPGWDDSIVGLNEAWDIVRAVFTELPQ